MTQVKKRNGHTEDFDPEKLELTCIRAALNSHLDDEEGKALGKEVLKRITVWLGDREEVVSNDLFDRTVKELEDLNKEVAFMYKTHRDIS